MQLKLNVSSVLRLFTAIMLSVGFCHATFAADQLLDTAPAATGKTLITPQRAKFVGTDVSESSTNTTPFSAPKTLLSGQQKNKFLSATQAFQFSARHSQDKLIIAATVTPAHYLYQQRFSVQGSSGLTVGKISFDQAPEFEDDPEFGRVPVFHRNVKLTVPVQGSGTLTLNWQGCAKAGVCYPPEQFQTNVLATAKSSADTSNTAAPKTDAINSSNNSPKEAAPSKTPIPAKNKAMASNSAKLDKSLDNSPDKDNGKKTDSKNTDNRIDVVKRPSTNVKVIALGSTPEIIATPLPDMHTANTTNQAGESMSSIDEGALNPNASNVTAINATAINQLDPANSMLSDPFGLAEHTGLALGLLFLAGLGLAFTPCVLPMLPIVANLVAAQHRRSAGHGFMLAAAYAIGVACSYAVLGALIALFGHQVNLIAWSQHPAILISFAAIFVLLALHTFDVFELRLPAFVRTKIEQVGQYGQAAKWSGSIVGCWVAGFFSALIVSPCLSAPLAGVLLSVSTVGNPWLGALALFCLGLGLGVPLMILGATEGKFLPKAGNWLNWVRRGFGLLLFGVALVLINRVFDAPWMLLLWAALVLMIALWLWYWAGRGGVVTKVASVIVGLWAVLLVVGAGSGATDPMRPLAPLTSKLSQAVMAPPPIATSYNLAQLQQYQQQYPYLLVELSADWCISCKIVERELFLQHPVPELQQWPRLKLDVTKTTDDSRAVLKAMNVFGPPAILLFKNGQQVEQLLGEPTREQLQAALQQHGAK